MTHYLVVAHQTADSDELLDLIRHLSGQRATDVTLLVPATPVSHMTTWTEGEARAVAAERAERAGRAIQAAGANLIDTRIGDANPYLAVKDELLVHTYDELIVSTFPLRKSRWLRSNLFEKLDRTVDVPITHVVAHSQVSTTASRRLSDR